MTSKAIRKEIDRQIEVMRDGAVDLHGEDDLRKRLAKALEEKRPLRVKLGMDPSSPDLHLGHTVVLEKLKRLQELGHTPIFLVGDFKVFWYVHSISRVRESLFWRASTLLDIGFP